MQHPALFFVTFGFLVPSYGPCALPTELPPDYSLDIRELIGMSMDVFDFFRRDRLFVALHEDTNDTIQFMFIAGNGQSLETILDPILTERDINFPKCVHF